MRRGVAAACVAGVVAAAVALLARGCGETGGTTVPGGPVEGTAAEETSPVQGSAANEPSKVRRAAVASAESEGADAEGMLRGVVRLREGGAPVAAATLRLRLGDPDPCIDERTGREFPVLDVGATERPFDAETATDAEGRFSFGRAPAGPWRVVATGEGFALGACTGSGPAHVLIDVDAARPTRLIFVRRGTDDRVPGVEVLLWDGAIEGPPDDRIAVDEANWLTLHVKYGTVVVARADGYATGITSSIWGVGDVEVAMDPAEAVTGAVLLPDGSPAVGAEVRLQHGYRPDPDGIVFRATTGADGAYALPGRGESAGWCRVSIDVSGFAPFYANVREGDSGLVVRLEEPAFVEATVVDAAGAPFDEVVVERWIPQRGSYDDSAVTRLADGRFAVGPLHPGFVRLRAAPCDPDRHDPATLEVPLLPGERRRDVRLVVRPRDPVTLRVRLRCNDEFLEGTVRVHGADRRETRVEVETPDEGAPVRVPAGETVEVAAIPEDTRHVPGPPVRVMAGSADAPATIDLQLREGLLVRPVAVDAESGRPVEGDPWYEVSGQDVRREGLADEFAVSDDARFRVRASVEGWAPYDAEHAASDVVDGQLVLRLSRGAVVRGRIVGEIPARSDLKVETRLPQDALTMLRAPVGADGRFELPGVGRGEGELHVRCGESVVHSVSLRVGDEAVSLGDVRIPSIRRLGGRVVDASGRGIAGADVTVGGDSTRTGSEGRFELFLVEGAEAVVHARWRYELARPVRVTDADDALRLVLEREPRILLRPPWPDPKPGTVFLREARGAFSWEARTGSVGDLLWVHGVPAGTWDVVFRRPSGDVVVRVDAAPGEVREIVVAE